MKNIYEIISETDYKTIYLVQKHKDGEWTCTCPQSKFNEKICKHIKKVMLEYYEEKRRKNY